VVLFTLLSFPILYFLIMGATSHYFARYALPLLPFLALLASWTVERCLAFLEEYIQIVKRSPIVQKAILVFITFLLILQPLISSLRFDYILSKTDTRTIAKEWIEENIPAGSKIAIDWITHTPPLKYPGFNVPNSKKEFNIIVPNFRGLFNYKPASWYRENNFDYLIASSFLYEVPLLDQELQRRREQFYKELGREYRLVKSFYPNENQNEPSFIFDEMYGPVVSLWQRERPGPVIKIYAVNPSGEP